MVAQEPASLLFADDEGCYYRIPLALLQQGRVPEAQKAAVAQELKHRRRPHRVGAHTVIRPPWREYAPLPGDIVIDIEPGVAFGDGRHPSTQASLLALQQRVRPGIRVLDVGTGSGILAIAAARYGAATVEALDTDARAVDIARANVERNRLAMPIRVRLGTIEPTPRFAGRYDLVVANILAPTISALAPALTSALTPGGRLIVSGILATQADWVRDALAAAGLGTLEQRQVAAWVAIEGVRHAASRQTFDLLRGE